MNFHGEKVVELPASKIKEAAALLTKVFWDDPMAVFLYPDIAERRDLQPSFYELNIEHASVGGELYMTLSFKGTAVWRFPGDETRRKVDAGKDPRDRLPDLMSAGPFERLMVIVECTYAILFEKIIWIRKKPPNSTQSGMRPEAGLIKFQIGNDPTYPIRSCTAFPSSARV